MTAKARPPAGAINARLTAGLQLYGYRLVRRLELVLEEVVSQTVARVTRKPKPSAFVRYAGIFWPTAIWKQGRMASRWDGLRGQVGTRLVTAEAGVTPSCRLWNARERPSRFSR